VQSIRHDVLPTLLVAELQRLQQQVADQATVIAELRTLLEEVRARR
jgi:hypothetical protein